MTQSKPSPFHWFHSSLHWPLYVCSTRVFSHQKKRFGCFDTNGSMWVSGGCRGVFSCDGVDQVKCDPCDPGPCPHGASFAVCPCVSSPPSPPAPKYLLLDDRNVVDAAGSTLVLGEVNKHPAGAMIREEKDYEMRFDNMQPNVWFDPKVGKWRAWYVFDSHVHPSLARSTSHSPWSDTAES
jgi:hypothetical protein